MFLRESKACCNPPPPAWHKRAFDHSHSLIGMDETGGGLKRRTQNADMFGRHAKSPAERQNVAGLCCLRRDLQEPAPSGLKQRFAPPPVSAQSAE